MADRVRPYLFYDIAVSICSTCYRKVEGKIVFENGAVFMLKRCPAHGSERVLMADDVEYYRRCREVFIKPPEMPLAFNTPVRWGCPYDCGLCADHQQHSCLSLVEITDRCNLECPICYAGSGPSRQQYRTLDHVQRLIDAVVRNEGEPDVVQISGGEPTVHPDFFAILDRAKAAPIRHLMVNTNGLRIAHDEEFAKRLAGYMPDFEVYLQFDSFEPGPLLALRGVDLRDVHARALERLNRLGISTTLVVTLKKGLNDGEIGRIIDLRRDAAGRTRRDVPADPGGRTARTLRSGHRPADADRGSPPDPRADHAVPAGRYHPGAVPSRQPRDGVRAQDRRQADPADRPYRSRRCSSRGAATRSSTRGTTPSARAYSDCLPRTTRRNRARRVCAICCAASRDWTRRGRSAIAISSAS